MYRLSSNADNDVLVEVKVCRLRDSDPVRLFSVLNNEPRSRCLDSFDERTSFEQFLIGR